MAAHKLLKRKGVVDEVGDDFSDFSLSSPATKIRRLDAELPPIVEEEEPLPLPLPNQERALVLFKPVLHHSPSSFSLTLDSDLISEIKNNQYPWSKQRDSDCERLLGFRSHEEEEEEEERNNRELALVPWVPSPSSRFDSDDTANVELMEADEIGGGGEEEGVMMDVEEQEDAAAVNPTTSSSTIHYPTTLNQNLHQGIGGITEGFQQHCMLPQFPQNTSTPITWTR